MKIKYDTQNYATEKEAAINKLHDTYFAFDYAHPEIFWLSGEALARILVAEDNQGIRWAYLFMILTDDSGFNMKDNEWKEPGAVAEGIARRETAIANILKQVNSVSPYIQIDKINDILTRINCYNSGDLSRKEEGNKAHECLYALEGHYGADGPVCEGYARAFKVLCDRLGIPCDLAVGYAKTNPDDNDDVLHMWNYVFVGERWYGVDVTWNDPTSPIKKDAPVSGYESEDYLLVGSKTVVEGLTFEESHPEMTSNSHAMAPFAFTYAN